MDQLFLQRSIFQNLLYLQSHPSTEYQYTQIEAGNVEDRSPRGNRDLLDKKMWI